MILEKDGAYVWTDDSEENTISNFTIELLYVIKDELGFKEYMINIKFQDNKFGPFPFKSSNWASRGAFIEYIGRCGGDFGFYGNHSQILAVKDFIFKKYSPRSIEIIDGYGNVKPNLWVADNGVIWKGEIIKADEDGISWIKNSNFEVEGFRTSTVNDIKSLDIPDELWSVKEIIERIHYLYSDTKLVWPLLGFATASIYFKKIAGTMGQFPVAYCYGEWGEGKTGWAEICASLAGGLIPAPSGESTVKGIHRSLSRRHSIPTVLNDAGGASKEAMVCSLFDLDPYVMGRRTTDSRTKGIGYNSPGIITSTRSMEREDALSRCVIINFNSYSKDDSKASEFRDFWTEGFEHGKNFGFLVELLKSEAEEYIIENIDLTQRALAEISAERGQKISARQIQVFGVLYGAFLTACDALDLWTIFDRLNMEVPDKKSISKSFGNLSLETNELIQEQEELNKFFRYIETLYHNNRLKTILRDGFDSEGEHIVFHLGSLISEIQKEDRMVGSRKLQGLSYGYFKSQIERTFGVESEPTSINGKSVRGYRIYIKQLREAGIDFHLSKTEYRKDTGNEEVDPPF